MCLPQLGLKLDGYGPGTITLFRGAELRHFTAPWKGTDRYEFHHTTHESCRNQIKTIAGEEMEWAFTAGRDKEGFLRSLGDAPMRGLGQMQYGK
jgi:hypothetical protein